MKEKILNKQNRTSHFLPHTSNGITLIALVITIIVMLILAGVTITMAINGGLFDYAGTATEEINHAIKGEIKISEGLIGEMSIDDIVLFWSDIIEELLPASGAGSKMETPNTWTSQHVVAINDGNGTAIPLPEDFYYVGGDYSTGLVISDARRDANGGTSYVQADILVGNQFVWIPVTSTTTNGVATTDLDRTNFSNSTGLPITGLNTNSYTEPMNYTSNGTEYTGYSTEESEYNTMRTQILKYGGFYIGRYEAGVDNTTLRTKVTTDQTVVCKKGVAPYNYIPWGQSVSDINTAFAPTNNNEENVSTHGAVYLSKQMYSSSNSVTSTLCYGSQWDAMCRYIGADSKKTTPRKNAVELTGSVSSDVSKNMYDLAGNCREWTMEAAQTRWFVRVVRGCAYDNVIPISYRESSWTTADSEAGYSFRPTLYIK